MSQAISNLAVGSKIKIGTYSVEGSTSEPIIWMKLDENHYKDSNNPSILDHVTLIMDKIIDLRGLDSLESSNTDANRQSYGNNYYQLSNLDQWLNSSGSANSWYVTSHSADESPIDLGFSGSACGYNDIQGFLKNFTTYELSKLIDTNISVIIPSIDDTSNSTIEVISRKVFSPSKTEIGLTDEVSGTPEGTSFSYFSSDVLRTATLTEQAYNNTTSTLKPALITDTWYYWLRTPERDSSYYQRLCLADGTDTVNYEMPYTNGIGIRSVINIDATTIVSGITDEDGCYTLVFDKNAIAKIYNPNTSQWEPVAFGNFNTVDGFYFRKNNTTSKLEFSTDEVSWYSLF